MDRSAHVAAVFSDDCTWTLIYDLLSSSAVLRNIVMVFFVTITREGLEVVSGTTGRENLFGFEYMSSNLFC